MDKIQRLKHEKEYEKYVNEKTPRHNVWLNMLKAFLLGGAICTLGQIIYHYCEFRNLSTDECSSWTSLMLVLFSVLLTGTGIYPRLAKWGGAGALVPITGPAPLSLSPVLPTPWLLLPLNTRRKGRSSESAVRSLPSQVP